MNAPSKEDLEDDLIFNRLEDQISWYDNKSTKNQRAYKSFKIIQIVAAALIPLLAAIQIPYALAITGTLGLIVTVCEGILQLNQYQQNWISYRSTCETLKHEKYLYLGMAAPYNIERLRAHSLLAERIESLVSQEHAKWASSELQNPAKQNVQ